MHVDLLINTDITGNPFFFLVFFFFFFFFFFSWRWFSYLHNVNEGWEFQTEAM